MLTHHEAPSDPQVHIRVASPPIRFPCYMGINIPTKEELIANRPEFQDIAGYIGEYRDARYRLFHARLKNNNNNLNKITNVTV